MTKPKAVTLALFCIAALLVPAHGLAAPPPPPARWTFMAYMSADNNLEHWFVQEFDEEYGKVGSDQNVNVVLLADRTPGYAKQAGNWTDTRFFYVDRGTTAADGVSWGERNMGDPATLVEFIKVVRKNYPAEKYVLLLWGHSWAWRPDETMWDDTDDDALDPDELAAALDAVGGVDVVAYDACEPQVIEMETVWRGHAGYVVASQDDVWWEGFRQNQVLTALKQDPTMDARALAVLLARHMSDWTTSVVAMDESWDTLLDAVADWSAALLAGLDRYRPYYDLAYDETQGMLDPVNKDLYDMAYEIWSAVPDDAVEIKATSRAVMDAFTGDLIPYEWHQGGNRYKTANGIGIFWPRDVSDLDIPNSRPNDFAYYQTLEFAALTGWDRFLAAYVGVPYPYVP